MYRTTALMIALTGATAAAQTGWGGYVRGWGGSQGQTVVLPIAPPVLVCPAIPPAPSLAPTSADRIRAVELEAEALALERQRVELAQQWLAVRREQARLEQEAQRLEALRAELTQAAAALRVEPPPVVIKEAKPAEAIAAPQEPAKPAAPPTKGPPIHRWVDEDGTVYFSTRPRR